VRLEHMAVWRIVESAHEHNLTGGAHVAQAQAQSWGRIDSYQRDLRLNGQRRTTGVDEKTVWAVNLDVVCSREGSATFLWGRQRR
jgi:hypothetical protein